MSFAAPKLLPLLALAPLAAALVWMLMARRTRAESAWVGGALEGRLRSGGTQRPRWIAPLLLGLALLGLAGALTRPRWGHAEQTVERKGIDLVFVIDSSLSMAAGDVSPSRFWLAQSIVRSLAAHLPGHRLALVAAEGAGEVLSPLTVDAAVLDLLLDALAPGTLPLPGTRLAPSLERALTLFPEGGDKHRALLVLSDGEDHGSEMAQAIDRLREAGVVVHAIGIGTEAGAPLPLAGAAGEFKRDRSGRVVISQLHRQPLEAMAEATGGIYLEATSVAFDPTPIAARISAMGGRALESTTLTLLEEQFQWPLAVAAGALALGLLLSPWQWRSRQEAA